MTGDVSDDLGQPLTDTERGQLRAELADLFRHAPPPPSQPTISSPAELVAAAECETLLAALHRSVTLALTTCSWCGAHVEDCPDLDGHAALDRASETTWRRP